MNTERILLLLLALCHMGIARAQTPIPAVLPILPVKADLFDSEGINLLRNGNFEEGTSGWQLLTWEKDGRMAIDEKELHEGKPTLRVDNHEIGHSFVRQIVKGKANTRYRFTGYIKTENIEPESAGKKTGAMLMVGRLAVYTPLLDGTHPWTKVSVDFNTGDDAEIRLGPSLGTDFVFPKGTAWFSGLKLIELGQLEVGIQVPERAKIFLDPVELLLRSAPAGLLLKLKDDASDRRAIAELNRYFAENVLNRSIVLHTTVEAAEPEPDVRNAFRIRAAGIPISSAGGTMKRLSWLYFHQPNAAEANSIKVGAEITVTGWIRRCEVVVTTEGLRLNFDLQHTKILSSSMSLPGQAGEGNMTRGIGDSMQQAPPAPGATAGSDDINEEYTRAGYPLIDLRRELKGTSWKSESGQVVRPGLSPQIKFNGKALEPADYRYEANAHDNTVTVFFNHGDSQLMLLTDEKKRLRFTFGGRDYTYELIPSEETKH